MYSYLLFDCIIKKKIFSGTYKAVWQTNSSKSREISLLRVSFVHLV